MTPPATSLNTTDFVVIVCQTQIRFSADRVWSYIGVFVDAGRFLNVSCKLVSATRGIGSVRRVNDSILEVMVGETTHSYSYAQIVGPMSHLAYHGCLSLAATDDTSCMLTYTITYDQTQLEGAMQQGQSERIRERFQGAVDAMKSEAEQGRA